MTQLTKQNQQGFAHIFAIIAIVLTVGAVGATGYYSYQKQQDKNAAEQQAKTAEQVRLAKLAADKKALEEKKATTEPVAEKPAACTRDTTMYVKVTEGHRLRSARDMNASGVVAVPYAAAVKAGCLENGWYSAEYNGQAGYAYAEYLTTSKPVAAVVTPTQATGNMKQSMCLTVSTLYTVKSPTTVYKFDDSGKVVSAGQTVAKGTAITGGECAQWAGNDISGYWIRDAKLYSFNDLSTVKP